MQTLISQKKIISELEKELLVLTRSRIIKR